MKIKSVYADLYNKELRQIKQFIRRAEKRGFSFPSAAIPPKPKRITAASVRRLKSITPDKLYKKAKYKDPYSDEVLTGIQGRKVERSRAAQKGVATKGLQLRVDRGKDRLNKIANRQIRRDIRRTPVASPDREQVVSEPARETEEVLRRVEERIARYQPTGRIDNTRYVSVLGNMLYGAISAEGRPVVAARLQLHSDAVNKSTDAVMHDSNPKRIFEALARLGEIIKGYTLTPKESKEISEMLEQWEVGNGSNGEIIGHADINGITFDVVSADEEDLPF